MSPEWDIRDASAEAIEQQAEGSELVVSAHDGWDVRQHDLVRAACRRFGVPWIPVRAELGRAVVGPTEVPGRPGCGICAELRRHRIRKDPNGFERLWSQNQTMLADRPAPRLTGLAGQVVGALVAAQGASLRTGPADSAELGTEREVIVVDLGTLRITRHAFLPDPACGHCGKLPPDTAESARLTLVPRPKRVPDGYRWRPAAEFRSQILRAYVDREFGLIREVTAREDGVVAMAEATIGTREVFGMTGFGSGDSRRGSEMTAALEALERYGGMQPGGKRTTVRGSYTALREHAIDPRTLGLHDPARYELPGSGWQPFREADERNWVWGYSFARKQPVLVPETVAYYWMPADRPSDPPFVYECSNGCALGGCLEEAILYGVMEVAERDAFLLSWYARMPIPRIDLSSFPDRRVRLLAATLNAKTGVRAELYDSTVEQGIPCIWAMLVDESDDPRLPKALCSGAAHLDPSQAALRALYELGVALAQMMHHPTATKWRIPHMLSDSRYVREMLDHELLYTDSRAFDRFSFLLEESGECSFEEAFRGRPERVSADLADDALGAIQRYLDTGLDVVVVDQTTAEHRVIGLRCVKIVIPGTLPMTFGHHNRRLVGLPRVLTVPRLLGYRQHDLRPDELNEYPHPFP